MWVHLRLSRPPFLILVVYIIAQLLIFLFLLYLGQITAEESLFTYGPNESVATFANASFEPMFVENIQWADNATRDAASLACDDDVACLFDAASTNDVSIGTNSKDVNVQLVKENEELGKPIPRDSVGNHRPRAPPLT